ncbi:MAG TPA: MMPL family transporter, partial [Geobacteraceae bacterium]
ELRLGKPSKAAVDAGYDKAFLTIMDSHVTTLITAAVLFQFGTGPVKGFAVSLSLGIIINLFTSLVANLGMVLNIVYLMGALAALGATLTLPGIAAIVLLIGMSVDSNVLIFERIREEMRLGKTAKASLDAGYDKAFLTIMDSHVTTLITAAVLFQFGTGPVKGFAVSLSLGIIINLFTSLLATKVVFDSVLDRFRVKRLSI